MKQLLRRLAAVSLACVCLAGAVLVPAAAAPRFKDVPETHRFAADLVRAADLGLISGRKDGTFGLGEPMTRASFVRVLCRLFQWEPVSPAAGSFADNQDPSASYYAAVETAFRNGALTQQEDEFRPHDPILRQEMAVMLVRALGYGTIAGLAQSQYCPFTDVTANQGYLILAYELGLMRGNSSGAFQPDKAATREQAAVVLVRLYDKLHAPAPALCGVASSDKNLTLEGMGAVAVPAAKLIYNGSVQLVQDLDDSTASAIRAAAEAAGVKQLLLVSGSAAALRGGGDAAEKISALAAAGGWDGVMLDIPQLVTAQREDFTALASALRAAGRLLYVVAEAPSRQGTPYRGYDFAALSQLADRLILRPASYSKLISGFPTAPREPLEEVYYALASLNGAVPADKLSLWLTASGSAWTGGASAGDVSAAELAQLLNTSGVMDYWSSRYASAYLSRTVRETRTVVWYHDARASQARRQLLDLFGGGGFCLSDLAGPLTGETGVLTGLK